MELTLKNHEEADTRLILHVTHALVNDCLRSIRIRSPFGDTDVRVLTIAHLFGLNEKVFLDNGRSESRHLIIGALRTSDVNLCQKW